jgi:quercetin dioxygenase-like cupin family protein
MTIQNVPFNIVNWNKVAPIEHKGESGISFWKTFEAGNIRIRMVEFLPGFKADHYCERGHVLLVLDGELWIKLKDENQYKLLPGMSLHTQDEPLNPHLVYTLSGAKVFIVD